MPPIMGAAAFLMAEYSSTSYSTIAVKAILPAVLYFAGVFISVHLEAKKTGLKGMSKDHLPRFFDVLFKKGYLLVPLIADGLLQLCTPYESGNLRRLATGLLFGYGLTVLLLTSLGWAYQWGFGFGKTLLDP